MRARENIVASWHQREYCGAKTPSWLSCSEVKGARMAETENVATANTSVRELFQSKITHTRLFLATEKLTPFQPWRRGLTFRLFALNTWLTTRLTRRIKFIDNFNIFWNCPDRLKSDEIHLNITCCGQPFCLSLLLTLCSTSPQAIRWCLHPNQGSATHNPTLTTTDSNQGLC